jgi:hypothetical protein
MGKKGGIFTRINQGNLISGKRKLIANFGTNTKVILVFLRMPPLSVRPWQVFFRIFASKVRNLSTERGTVSAFVLKPENNLPGSKNISAYFAAVSLTQRKKVL